MLYLKEKFPFVILFMSNFFKFFSSNIFADLASTFSL